MLKKIVAAGQRLRYGAAPEGGPGALDAVAFTALGGEDFDLAQIQGKVVLFVNVASKCGLTPQYGQLAELQQKYSEQGFTVVGVPCNQFLGQEPGGPEEITSCALGYGADFPLLEKQEVNGAGRSALYQWLIGSEAGGGENISWNFEKFLVNRDGQVVARFDPRTTPDADNVVAAIEAALA